MIDATQLEAIRDGYRRRDDYARFVSDRARLVLDEIMASPRFAGATDPVTLSLIAVLLRVTQPQRVLQLGTHIGFSAVLIGDVLAHNSRPGSLVTVDPNPLAHELAGPSVEKAGLANTVTLLGGYSTEPRIDEAVRLRGPFDVVYLDSSHSYAATLEELDLIFEKGPWLAEHGLLILHDAAARAAQFDKTGQGGVRRALDEWVAPRAHDYQLLVLEQPLWPSVCGVGLVARRPE